MKVADPASGTERSLLQTDTASEEVMDSASLEGAEDMKENGLEGSLREVMRGSETGTQLGSGWRSVSLCLKERMR